MDPDTSRAVADTSRGDPDVGNVSCSVGLAVSCVGIATFLVGFELAGVGIEPAGVGIEPAGVGITRFRFGAATRRTKRTVGGTDEAFVGMLPHRSLGTVTGEVFQRVCIVRSGATSFLVLTEENSRGFDNWLETAEDVARYLDGLQVAWDAAR